MITAIQKLISAFRATIDADHPGDKCSRRLLRTAVLVERKIEVISGAKESMTSERYRRSRFILIATEGPPPA